MILSQHGIIASISVSGFDPDAQAFITAAGITDATQQNAINQLVLDLKGYSIWTKFYFLYPFVGGDATKHSYNLKNPAAYQITWGGTVTHDANGVTGNGTTGYGDPGFNLVTAGIGLNDFGFGVHSKTNSARAEAALGCRDGGAVGVLMNIRNATDVSQQQINSDATAPVQETGITSSLGHFGANRTVSTEMRINRNGTTSTLLKTSGSSILGYVSRICCVRVRNIRKPYLRFGNAMRVICSCLMCINVVLDNCDCGSLRG